MPKMACHESFNYLKLAVIPKIKAVSFGGRQRLNFFFNIILWLYTELFNHCLAPSTIFVAISIYVGMSFVKGPSFSGSFCLPRRTTTIFFSEME